MSDSDYDDPDHDYDEIQKSLDAAMPYVGLYIAAASAVCIVAMGVDALSYFLFLKMQRLPKLFSLNAASLTLLAVATKLALDFNSELGATTSDWFAKLISLSFMSTALTNFTPSLGSMTNNELVANVVGLGILVITIVVNMIIQLVEVPFDLGVKEVLEIMIPMVFSFVTLASLAVTVPAMKRSLESKFQEKHRVAFREEEELRRSVEFKIDDRKEYMMKYLVMAETCSPQFVVARSVVCSSSAIACLSTIIILVVLFIEWACDIDIAGGESAYKSSTTTILIIQSLGVGVGMVVPLGRWFVAVGFRCSTLSWDNVRRGFRIEAYWIQSLKQWRDSFSSLQLRESKCRKYLHNLKWFALTICIGLQLFIVLLSKLLFFLSVLLMYPFLFCYTHFKRCVKRIRHGDQDGGEADVSLNRYVLVLEGEPVLPTWAVKKIISKADHMIKRGKKKQPKNLVDHLNLNKSVNFKGVLEFDQIQSSLHSEEPPNSWALPIATLTSIAIALPNIAKDERRRLLSSVGEGLSLVKIVEETLVQDSELINIEKAADICWGGVVHYQKWLDFDLQRMSVECESIEAMLQELSAKAESIMEVFKREEQGSTMETPLNWPPRVLAANSMYRISQTILLSYQDEGLYKRLSVMIADILAACLTNLPRAITTMCHRNAIEKREENVEKAFLLLGKTEQVVQLLQERAWPNLDHDRAAYIDEWRSLLQLP